MTNEAQDEHTYHMSQAESRDT